MQTTRAKRSSKFTMRRSTSCNFHEQVGAVPRRGQDVHHTFSTLTLFPCTFSTLTVVSFHAYGGAFFSLSPFFCPPNLPLPGKKNPTNHNTFCHPLLVSHITNY